MLSAVAAAELTPLDWRGHAGRKKLRNATHDLRHAFLQAAQHCFHVARPSSCRFAGCHLLGGIGWLLASWEQLELLDLSETAVDDADLAEVAEGCPNLRSLNLSGCTRIKGPGLLALEVGEAVEVRCSTCMPHGALDAYRWPAC